MMKTWMVAGVVVALVWLGANGSRAQSDPGQSPSATDAAPAQPSPSDRQARGAKVRAACQADIQKFCPDAGPGRETFQCIRQHQDDLSDSCKTALASMRSQWHGRPGDGAAGGAPPPDGAAPPPAPPN